MNERVETEMGVPIPGEILDPERWTKTALKKLPPEGPLDLSSIFGRTAPLIVDLGCGNGRFLLGSALARPECDHLGVDILPMVLRYATRRANQRGLANLRWAAIDAQTLVGKYLAERSVREMHCYHPQPFHDLHEIGRRLITPDFLVQTVRVLEPGGLFFVQTDNGPYWKYIKTVLPTFFDFQEKTAPWPDTPQGRSRREILASKRGLAIYRGFGVVKPLTTEEAKTLAKPLPLPRFHAGKRHRELDELERNDGRMS